MSLCVPEWDSSGLTLDDGMPPNDFLELAEGKGEFTRYKRSHLSHLATVPDQHSVDLSWTTDGHVDMQGQNNKGNKPQWQGNYSPSWNNGQETEDGVLPSKPPASKDTTLEAVGTEAPAEPPSVPAASSEDDEMVSWLQYPLDDTLEKNYCSDFFGGLPASDMQNMQVLKESFASQGAGKMQRMPHHGSTGNDAAINRVASAETAMLLGAGRAAGLLPQAGVEVFTKVRTLQPVHTPVTKWQIHSPVTSKGFTLSPTVVFSPASRLPSAPMLPPKSLPVTGAENSLVHPARVSGPMNFSHFSRPAALMKANLHSLTGKTVAAPQNMRIRQHLGKPVVEASASTGSSIAESTMTGGSRMELQKDVQVQPGNLVVEQQNGNGDPRWLAVPSSATGKETRDEVSEEEIARSKSKPMDQDACHLSSVTGSVPPDSLEKAGSQRTQLPEAQEPTITSSSGGSGTSAQRAKEATTSNKRKSRENDDTDCPSEDGEEESVDLKKPVPGRGSTAKRSRAAEVHNLSERRRRDRINEKMKALQELIPNSNKTDKASMLDEAIEYLKMLQLQLQMMSMRSGMSLPPMVMPSGLPHHVQMPMTALPPMAMGMMGMQMGLGMSMMDLGAPASGRPVGPVPPHGGSSHDGSVSSSLNMVDVHDPRLHTSSVMDSLNVGFPHQGLPQGLPLPPGMNLDMYSAYVLQQHQHQHQHQHHHHHHQPPNMGWGPSQ